MLQRNNQSNNVCLEHFFGAQKAPSKSAFTQARAKLNPLVFKHICTALANFFYQKNKAKTWKGHRLLAADGSTVALPNHATIEEKYPAIDCGPNADSPNHLALLSYLYDVANGLVINSEIAPRQSSEMELVNRHLNYLLPNDILLLDRYYNSMELMLNLLSMGAHFLIRMKNSWLCVKEFLAEESGDKEVELTHQGQTFKVRLIKQKRNGKTWVWATSLLDKTKYSAASIRALYRQRWQVEEAYKLLKCRLELGDFTGKTATAIEQDYYAKTLLITLNSMLLSVIKVPPTKKKNKVYIVNRTYGLYKLKEFIKLLHKGKTAIELIAIYLDDTKKYLELKVLGKHRERKKNTPKKFSINYKTV